MSDWLDSSKGWVPPLSDEGAPAHFRPQNLEGTGETESSNAVALRAGKLYALHTGAVPLRVVFSVTGGESDKVPNNGGTVIPANYVYPFMAIKSKDGSYGSIFVYAEAADGSSEYLATVYQREP